MLRSSFKWPCRIGVISDTHIENAWHESSRWDSLQRRQFAGVDLVLHAGDLVDEDLLSHFSFCPVLAVCGNMDRPSKDLPGRRIIRIGPFRIGLIHGWGSPRGLEERLLGAFAGEKIDCLVYGHSHMPACHRANDLLFFNPGSPTERRSAPCHSVGLLEVADSIGGQILALD